MLAIGHERQFVLSHIQPEDVPSSTNNCLSYQILSGEQGDFEVAEWLLSAGRSSRAALATPVSLRRGRGVIPIVRPRIAEKIGAAWGKHGPTERHIYFVSPRWDGATGSCPWRWSSWSAWVGLRAATLTVEATTMTDDMIAHRELMPHCCARLLVSPLSGCHRSNRSNETQRRCS